MPSTAAYDAITIFLLNEGEAKSVFGVINAEQPALMVAGSVVVARERRTADTRRDKSFPLNAEIIPQSPGLPRSIGIGFVERDVILHIELNLNRKAPNAGALSLNLTEDMARAIAFAYNAVSNLPIAGVNFRHVRAEVIETDEASADSPSRARSTVQVIFTYTEAMEDNS